MPGELDKIRRMLEEGAPDLQGAAARVLGELKPADPAVRKALARGLKSSDESVRLACLEGLARLDPELAIPHILPLLSAAEPARSRAQRVLEALGPGAAKELGAQLAKADPEARKAILESFGQLKGIDPTDVLFAGMLDADLDVVRRAAAAYRQRVEALAPADRSAALKRLVEFMESSRVQKAKTPLASCLQIVGALRDPWAAKAILPYVDRKQPPAVRTSALVALGQMTLEGPVARATASKVLPLLEEADFNGIVKPALDLLGRLPLAREDGERVLKLVRGGPPAVKLFALRALGGVGSAEAGEALLESLWGNDPQVATLAEAALASNPAYIPLLVRALEEQKDLPRAWKVVNALRAHKGSLDREALRKLEAKCFAAIEKREPAGPALFEVLRSAEPAALKESLLKKARQWIGQEKYDEAERALRLLQAPELASPESEFALAVAQLRKQRLDPAQAGRDRGHAVQAFARLARVESFPFRESLERDAALLSPAGLLYLGFALVEHPMPDRAAGAEVLKFLVKKYGAKEEGKIARQKLKTQGAG